MGLGEAGISGEILDWLSTSLWEAVAWTRCIWIARRVWGCPQSTGSCVFLRNYASYNVARKESTWLQLWVGLSYGQFSWPRTPSSRHKPGLGNQDELKLTKRI